MEEQKTNDEQLRASGSGCSDIQITPVPEGQMLGLASLIQEVHANRQLRAFLEEIWGHQERIDTVALASVAQMGGEVIHSITVWDEQGCLLLPDLALPFWQAALAQGDVAPVDLGQLLQGCESDEDRLEAVCAYLYSQGTFRAWGLPEPSHESSFYERPIKLSTVPMAYPLLYSGASGRGVQGWPGELREFAWPSDLDVGVRVSRVYADGLQEIYNSWAEFPADLLYRVARHLAETKGVRITLPPEGHVCYLWNRRGNSGRRRHERYLIELEFTDDLLLLRLFVLAETIPLERVNLFDREIDIPVHRVNTPLPDHPASAWFMEVVRALEAPPALAVTAQVSQEMASEWIWSVCEELAGGLAKIDKARDTPFPRPLADLEAEHLRLGKRLKRMEACTQMTRLNVQAEIVCLAAQILLQRYTPEDDVQMPWMLLLHMVDPHDHASSILAARAKVAYLVAHPELAGLPTDSGCSLRGPMRAVGMAIREAIRQGVYR